jgi:hypothetical protein
MTPRARACARLRTLALVTAIAVSTFVSTAAADDTLYVRDPPAGSVSFGNGASGRGLPAGTSLATTFRGGQGRAGNILSPSIERAAAVCAVLGC